MHRSQRTYSVNTLFNQLSYCENTDLIDVEYMVCVHMCVSMRQRGRWTELATEGIQENNEETVQGAGWLQDLKAAYYHISQ